MNQRWNEWINCMAQRWNEWINCMTQLWEWHDRNKIGLVIVYEVTKLIRELWFIFYDRSDARQKCRVISRLSPSLLRKNTARFPRPSSSSPFIIYDWPPTAEFVWDTIDTYTMFSILAWSLERSGGWSKPVWTIRLKSTTRNISC